MKGVKYIQTYINIKQYTQPPTNTYTHETAGKSEGVVLN